MSQSVRAAPLTRALTDGRRWLGAFLVALAMLPFSALPAAAADEGFNLLDSLKIIDPCKGSASGICKDLGGFETLVVAGINLLGLALLVIIVWRLAIISFYALADFRKGEGDAASILRGAVFALGATFVAGALAWVALNWTADIVVSQATTAAGDIATKNQGALADFLDDNPSFKRLYEGFQAVATALLVVVSIFMVGRTGIEMLRKIRYASSGADSGNTFEPVKAGAIRLAVIILLAIFGWIMIDRGPEILFSILESISGGAAIT